MTFVAEYGKDLTGHTTDVYMAANEWCCVENNEYGVALFQKDTQLVEFDHIHSDKTDYGCPGSGSAVYSYFANDWLQKHISNGDEINLTLRYAITSYSGDYVSAGIAQKAEIFCTEFPVRTVLPQDGNLPTETCSFLSSDRPLRLLTLKVAENEKGMIARVFGEQGELCFNWKYFGKCSLVINSITETAVEEGNVSLFRTYRIPEIKIEKRKCDQEWKSLRIGGGYTGLISDPCAASGEGNDMLYLLWGKCFDVNLSHYMVYRSVVSGFIPDQTTFIEKVMPEKYVVESYIDTGLLPNTVYYYRVCCVDKNGNTGVFSDEFSGRTKNN